MKKRNKLNSIIVTLAITVLFVAGLASAGFCAEAQKYEKLKKSPPQLKKKFH